ncbi:ribosome maturation factor RimP [Oceanirhabdus sp. W0125-5]|uniref:ribosome maturation factor RimP n=1 Tax=Oceanirhabdus sp. W0125-5 TaxID=2999116 RepID=UPI0022F33D44|nr:ribosome maturation factor RimP [Oceanirhabdus sp. W0125-5]WBW94830.1 ribosome maturation factor RimP [Oceanirhabdus sp. W0125-5]
MITEAKLNELRENVKTIVNNEGFELYHIEYVKENNEFYLRIYIDSESGVTINDCVDVTRKLSNDYLDVEDPIDEAYILEISSPGIERVLYTKEHYRRYINHEVKLSLSKLHCGKKKFEGVLKDFNDNEVIIEGEDVWTIPNDKIKRIKLKGEF